MEDRVYYAPPLGVLGRLANRLFIGRNAEEDLPVPRRRHSPAIRVVLTGRPFDAVLVVAFGGPQGPADIRPFLANVLRGRRVPAERVEEVARHYELFGGVSPLTAITRRQADGLRTRLAAAGVDVPVYLGMRNWHPLLPDVLRTMAKDGVRRAIGFVCAPHRSYSSCTQYRQNVVDARAELAGAGLQDVAVTYVGDWHAHEGFIDANAGPRPRGARPPAGSRSASRRASCSRRTAFRSRWRARSAIARS